MCCCARRPCPPLLPSLRIRAARGVLLQGAQPRAERALTLLLPPGVAGKQGLWVAV